MGDSVYSEFLLEMGTADAVKQEPTTCMASLPEIGPSSASVPIPGGHRGTRTNYDQFSPSPLANPALWGSSQPGDFLLETPFKLELQDSLDPLLSFKMDDDDIFQVDKADLIQGPTLAELNANDDTLLGDLNFDDLLLPDESMQPLRNASSVDLPASSSLFNTTGFASTSLPQSIPGYRNCLPYANMSTVGLSGVASIVDPSAVNPPTFTNRRSSNLTGL